MKVTCDVIRDLLPLYLDGVCSEDSRQLVEEHLQTCESCRRELAQLQEEQKPEVNVHEAEGIRRVSAQWKRDRRYSFLKGITLLAWIAAAACIIAYNAIGSYVAADGTLIEPFGFIPLFYLFALIGLISGLILLIARRRKQL